MMNINEIDQNMKVETNLQEPDLVFFDVRKDPFDVYGLYNYREEPDFIRLPQAVADTVNPGVARLCKNTAGGRVRFSSDSLYVAIHAIMPTVCKMSHMAYSGSIGFDLFVDDPDSGVSRFYRPFHPDVNVKDGFETIVKFRERKLRYFTVNFPSYSDVRTLYIGLQADAAIGHGLKYRDLPPIVYYGSSITQGACASRPGNAYQNIISRRNNIDFLNLGFSGNGKGEETIARYMAALPMSAFVCDYDHNAPDPEHLRKTHCRLYQIIREKHPDIPYIMLSKPDFDSNWYEINIERRDVIVDTYRYAIAQGDQNVYYIDGASLFRGTDIDICTVDGCHPTDHGFWRMAEAIDAELNRAFTQNLFH